MKEIKITMPIDMWEDIENLLKDLGNPQFYGMGSYILRAKSINFALDGHMKKEEVI